MSDHSMAIRIPAILWCVLVPAVLNFDCVHNRKVYTCVPAYIGLSTVLADYLWKTSDGMGF